MTLAEARVRYQSAGASACPMLRTIAARSSRVCSVLSVMLGARQHRLTARAQESEETAGREQRFPMGE